MSEKNTKMPDILVVDDTPANLQLLAGMLKERGFRVRPVPSGKLAISAVQKQKPDLILLDINMPEMNGYEVCKYLKADEALKDIPILFISALDETIDKVKAFAAGGVDYVTKPFQFEEVEARVITHLELSRLQQELESRNRQLKDSEAALMTAKVAADASNRAKSDFLANMSHELRTPLGAIIGFSELLEEKIFGDLNPKQEEYIKDIVGSGRHLLSLINDILDLAKIESGKMELELSTFPMASLLEDSLIMVKEKCLRHGISLTTDIEDPVKALVVSADERKLKQVMFNLLSNAAKFTSGGTIKVSARLSKDSDVSTLCVSVSDTGVGIAREHQSKLFNEFYQVNGGAKDKSPGTGLGLALVKHIVEQHGGRVWMDSEGEGKGSTFHFSLPISA